MAGSTIHRVRSHRGVVIFIGQGVGDPEGAGALVNVRTAVNDKRVAAVGIDRSGSGRRAIAIGDGGHQAGRRLGVLEGG